MEIPKEIRDFEIDCQFFHNTDWESIPNFRNKVFQFAFWLENNLIDKDGSNYKSHIIGEYNSEAEEIKEVFHKDDKKSRELTKKLMKSIITNLDRYNLILRGTILDNTLICVKPV